MQIRAKNGLAFLSDALKQYGGKGAVSNKGIYVLDLYNRDGFLYIKAGYSFDNNLFALLELKVDPNQERSW